MQKTTIRWRIKRGACAVYIDRVLRTALQETISLDHCSEGGHVEHGVQVFNTTGLCCYDPGPKLQLLDLGIC